MNEKDLMREINDAIRKLEEAMREIRLDHMRAAENVHDIALNLLTFSSKYIRYWRGDERI